MIGSRIPRQQVEGFEPDTAERPKRTGPPHDKRPGGQQRNSRYNSAGRGRSRGRTS
jgi:hypothetical protein